MIVASMIEDDISCIKKNILKGNVANGKINNRRNRIYV